MARKTSAWIFPTTNRRNLAQEDTEMATKRKSKKLNKYVTLCRWSAKQTIPLSVLARNQTKGLDSRSRRDRKWVRERERSWTKELIEVSWRRVTRVASRHRTSERPVGWDRVQRSEGRPVKMSQHSSWVVEFLLEIHASVCLQGMQSVT